MYYGDILFSINIKRNKNGFQSKAHLLVANKNLQFDIGMTLTFV